MAWIPAAIGAAASVYSAVKSDNRAEEQTTRASDANQQMADIASAQWNRYLKAFAPLENTLVKEAKAPIEQQPGYGRMMATINRGYSDLEGNVKRTMGGRYPSGSGLERQAVRNVGLQKTTARTGAVADMMTQRFNRMLQAANIGRGLPAQAIVGSSGRATGSTNLANLYGQAAKSGWDSTGASLGNLMQLLSGAAGGSTQWGGWENTLAGSAAGADSMYWV